ncbi:YtcA family lipoprotein [Undibacterium rugosum]|uniref:YtcA family lipoprotein n=1 Tax=Undibacterium rugosum TaxID=2762291 RepID=UPI001B810A91|nr:YtcA family lipoprotein [Undibacterium rugosum]MBR7777578.1 hypothetical protein [Undibacterium rugosum]
MLTLTACVSPQAPSLIIAGAYFPAWLLCAAVGVIVAIVFRLALLKLKLADLLPYPLFLCLSVGVLAAMLIWLIWFGR